MYIHIIHAGNVFKGKVIYNFNQLKNIILLKFDRPIIQDKRDLMLFCQDKTWNDDASVKETFPEMFEQILVKLQNVLNEAFRLK